MVVHSIMIAIFMLLSALPAHAIDDAQIDNATQILHYEVLMKFTQAQREEYVRQVRNMLMEFEKSSVDHAKAKRLSAKLLFLEQLIERADAMGGGGGGAAAAYARAQQAAAAKAAADRARARASNDKNWFANYYRDSLACVETRPQNEYIQYIIATKGTYACVSPKPSLIMKAPQQICPLGMTRSPVVSRTPGRSVVCVRPGPENLSFDQFKAKRAAAAKASALAAARADRARIAGHSETSVQSNQRRRVASASTGGAPTETDAGGSNGQLAEMQARLKESFENDVNTDLSRDRAKGKDIHVVRDQFKNPHFLEDNQQFSHDIKRGENVCGAAPTGVPDAESCSDDKVVAARYIYQRSKEPHCIYAGNLSHFANKQNRPGNCIPPKSFCLSDVTCFNAKGVKKTSETPMTCANPNQVVCNPYLFNLKKDHTPLCVDQVADATQKCEEARMSEQAPEFIFITKSGDLTKPDGSSELTVGVQEGWNAMADEINSICFTTPAKIVYCKECAILKKRAFELNMSLISKDDIQDDQKRCHMLARFEISTGLAGSTASPAQRTTTPGAAGTQ